MESGNEEQILIFVKEKENEMDLPKTEQEVTITKQITKRADEA